MKTVWSDNSGRLRLSEIRCWTFFFGKFRRCWKILHRFSGSTKCYPCQGLGIFRHGKIMAAGKSASPSGTLLDFLFWDRHSLLEFFLGLDTFRTGKKGHYERGLFTGESLESLESPNSLESVESGRGVFSRISRKSTFLKDPLFPKEPFFRTRYLQQALVSRFGCCNFKFLLAIPCRLAIANHRSLEAHKPPQDPETQRAAKGGTQKGVGHFFLFRSPFRTHFVTFLTFSVTFLRIPFCLPPFSSRNRLPFMILSPPGAICRKIGLSAAEFAFSYSKMQIPPEKCIFLQKNAFFLQKNALSCRKMLFSGGTGQETAGNCRRVAGLKNHETLANFHKTFCGRVRNTNKNAFTVHKLFRKLRANFCLLPYETSQEPNRNCSEKFVQMNFLIFGEFWGPGVLPLNLSDPTLRPPLSRYLA